MQREDTEGRWKRDIERRLRIMETAPRAANTSISDDDGNVVVRLSRDGIELVDAAGRPVLNLSHAGLFMYDADGELRTLLGQLGDDHYGIVVSDADGTTARLWIDERGIHTPYLTVPAVAADDFTPVTAAVFTTTHRAQFESISHQGLYAWVTVTAGVATTGEFRLRIPATGAVTDVVAVAAEAQVVQQFRWLHGLDLNAGPVVVEVEARRTSGAGDVNVYRPPGMSLVAPGLCVADGIA